MICISSLLIIFIIDNADCLRFFHYGSEMQVCGLCASGKYFNQTSCVSTCPPGYFEHIESRHCQSKAIIVREFL